MRQKKGWKKMGMKFLAAVTAIGLLWQPSDINAAAWGRTSDSYTANGTFHIDQFGEYDINAEVTVTDGIITAVEITGDNFGGTYGDYNQNVKLPAAIAGMAEKFIGLGRYRPRRDPEAGCCIRGPPTLLMGSKKRL